LNFIVVSYVQSAPNFITQHHNLHWKRVEGKGIKQRGMVEAPENGKKSSHSARKWNE
jgi:hypothetical protein